MSILEIKNRNLNAAKKGKNDEFYTRTQDIERELGNYRDHFRGKSVFLNCDDPEWSNFWKYFEANFEFLGLTKLTSTHFDAEKPTYKLEMFGPDHLVKTPLMQNGDFRSPESIEILKESDIVVTNPPFSLFREFVDQLTSHGKDFLIVGNKNAITYKEVFSLIMRDKLWLGCNLVNDFGLPDYAEKWTKQVDGVKIGSAPSLWYTNLPHNKRNEELDLYREFNPSEYPKYDNYDAINVEQVKYIPIDYDGIIGVPVTFLTKHNPEQFEVIGLMATTKITEYNFGYPYIDGKKKYARLLIKRKK